MVSDFPPHLVVVDRAGGEKLVRIECAEQSEEDDTVQIVLFLDHEQITGRSDRGFFYALQELRRTLELRKFLVACNGAAKNVYPSPMIESMGSGRKAYRTTLGEPAVTSDLVDIFGRDAALPPSTVEEQERFHKQWIQSFLDRAKTSG